MPDEEHWEVVVEFSGTSTDLAAELGERIDAWMRSRSLPLANIRLGETQVELSAQTG